MNGAADVGVTRLASGANFVLATSVAGAQEPLGPRNHLHVERRSDWTWLRQVEALRRAA